ncbi:MAG: N-acetyltransferase [Planctomycetota bacterium]|nr:MAG: N-acetyltransferase [Planctomycetota bacterium]
MRDKEKRGDIFIHPKALVESEEVGSGCRVWAFAHIMKGARVGRNCNICDHSFIESGVILGDGVTVKNGVQIYDGVVVEDEVFLGPNMIFTNDRNPRAGYKKDRSEFLPTLVKKGASIGANATIVCGVTIGTYAFVGAGSVVTKDVKDHQIVVGNPARAIGFMCCCGERLEVESLRCQRCGRLFREEEGGLRVCS